MNYRFERGSGLSGTLFGLMLIALTILLGVWLSHGILGTERWPIRWLEIDGSFERVNAPQVRGILNPVIDTGFFAVDLKKVRQTAARLPWVASVEARKRWPDTVEVVIVEHQPVAHWRSDQMISSEGVAFSVSGQRIQGLPQLLGPDPRLEAVLDMWLEIRQRLLPLGQDVIRMELQERGAWIVTLDNDVQLFLGRQAVLARLQRYINSWQILSGYADKVPASFDMRYTNGFAVGWRELSSIPESTESSA